MVGWAEDRPGALPQRALNDTERAGVNGWALDSAQAPADGAVTGARAGGRGRGGQLFRSDLM